MSRKNYKAIRLTDQELHKIESEIQNSDTLNSFSDFFREATKVYFNQPEEKSQDKMRKKINYIDETTAINLLMISDIIANRLNLSDEDMKEYIKSKKEELEKVKKKLNQTIN